MVTLNLKLYAAPLALLMMAAPLAAPKANAETNRDTRTFQAAFAYNPNATPAEIYADFERTADQACRSPGVRSLGLRQLDKQCAADLLQAAVKQLGRVDVAQIHGRTARG